MKGLFAIAPPLTLALLGALLALFSLWLGAALFAFGLLDARGRYRDFRYLSSCPNIDSRLARFYGRSFCGRWMVCAIDPMRWHFYRMEGFRLWHFLPVGFPQILINRRFWAALFGGHTNAR